jgi:hypothetical protein
MERNVLRPAIIGGVALGILSAVPIVNFLNVCCCAWAILGGMLAAYLYIKRSPNSVTTGEGAKLGAIAGVIGGGIYIVIGIPLAILTSSLMMSLVVSMLGSEASSNPVLAQYLRQLQSGAIMDQLPRIVIAGIGRAALLVGFSTVGGILAISLFEKRRGGPAEPPPPPPFPPAAGQPGSGYSAGYGAGSQDNYRPNA